MAIITRNMGPAQWGMLLGLSVLWGGSFFFVEVALENLPPLTLVFCRVFLAALMLHIIILATGRRIPFGAKLWVSFFVMGLLNNVIPFSLIFWGQTSVTGGLASILNATTPLWTILVAHFLTGDEKMTKNRLIGVIVGFSGAAVMIGPDLLGDLGTDFFAQAAILLAAMTYAFAGVYGRRFQSIPPIMTATGQLTASTILMIPLIAILDKPWLLPAPDTSALLAVLALAALSTALAYILYFKLLATAGATNLLLVTFLIPVSAIILGGVFLAESLTASQIAGMLLIGLGLLAIDGRFLRLIGFTRQSPKTD